MIGPFPSPGYQATSESFQRRDCTKRDSLKELFIIPRDPVDQG